MKRILLPFLTLGLAAGVVVWYVHADSNGRTHFRTVPVERGKVVARISATGTIQPEKLVDVGAQVAGQIKSFGLDPRDSTRTIDYCSPVEEGTILARLDDALFKSRVNNATADLQLADAELLLAEAQLRQAERDWNRVRDLGPRGVISGVDYDTVKATYEAATASQARAKAAVAKAKSVLDEAKINLSYTIIRSPVKGVIVDRRVNIGQTVVASLNAPSLFLIAQDLKRLEIWASVNEADIGQIFPGQQVRFTVDAYPDEQFLGEVTQIRLNASMIQNVVTYTVVVATNNSDGKLLPYLTANLQFEVSQRDDVLLLPNPALRWRPTVDHVAPAHRDEYARSLRTRTTSREDASDREQSQATLWVDDNGFVRPIQVITGVTDGVVTEIVKVVSGQLDEGTEVVSGINHDAGGKVLNPLMPQIRR